MVDLMVSLTAVKRVAEMVAMMDEDWTVEKEIKKVDMKGNAAVERRVVEMEWKLEFFLVV